MTRKIFPLVLAAVFLCAFAARALAGKIEDDFRKSVGADIVLILNGDDFGRSLTNNAGIEKAWEGHGITTTTMITPARYVPQALEYIKKHPDMDVGVHLNLAQDDAPNLFYGPVLPAKEVPSLVEASGLFPTTQENLARMKSNEIRNELDAQIRKALDAGVDVTHFDCHKGFYHGDMRIFKIVTELAEKYDLPMRLPNAGFARTLDKKGIMTTDGFAGLGKAIGETFPEKKQWFLNWIRNLKPGIYEVIVHVGTPDPDQSEAWRVDDMNLVLDPDVQALIRERGIRLTGYREIRDFQRARRKIAAPAEAK